MVACRAVLGDGDIQPVVWCFFFFLLLLRKLKQDLPSTGGTVLNSSYNHLTKMLMAVGSADEKEPFTPQD